MYICIKEYICIVKEKKHAKEYKYNLFITHTQLLYTKYVHIHRYAVVK